MDIYKNLKEALREEVEKNSLSGQNISVRCKALSSVEAIGKPEHDDYPIIKGKEVMVEAVFKGAKGQAFTDEFENVDYIIDDLLTLELDSNKKELFLSHVLMPSIGILSFVIKQSIVKILSQKNAHNIYIIQLEHQKMFYLLVINQGS